MSVWQVNLNLSEFMLLGRTSALTMNVAQVFKVLLLFFVFSHLTGSSSKTRLALFGLLTLIVPSHEFNKVSTLHSESQLKKAALCRGRLS